MGTVMITGASAGLGVEFAWQLATVKHDLVLVARNEGRLNSLADQLRQVAGVRVEVIVADLSVRDDLERVADRLRVGAVSSLPDADSSISAEPAPTGATAAQRPVGLLINNAGYALNTNFLDSDITAEEQSLDVLVRAVLVLSRAATEQMVSRGRGAILNVSSVAALLASGTYAAHKAWVRTFTESLAVELRGTGVTATVVAPGLTRTEFHERAGIEDSYPEFAWLKAHDVVSQSIEAVRRGQVIVTPSLRYQVASGLVRLMPRWAVRELGSTGVHGEVPDADTRESVN